MYQILAMLIAVSTLASCALCEPHPMPVNQATAHVAKITPCHPPVEPEKAVKSSLVGAYIETAMRLHECKDRMDTLSDLQKGQVKNER